MKALRILLACLLSIPTILYDFAQVLTEGVAVNPAGPETLLLPKLWGWALR